MDSKLANLKFQKEFENLDKWVSEWIGPDRVHQQPRSIFANLKQKSTGKDFLLRVDCGKEFPLEPADYKFVNPDTRNDDGPEFWPIHNQNAFKTGENPRWICLAGTLAYKKQHSKHQYNSKFNSISQTVQHVFLEINGWVKNV